MSAFPASGKEFIGFKVGKDVCQKGRKCIKKDGHKGECWPSDKP